MPRPDPSSASQSLEQAVAKAGCYPVDAFHFVHQGLGFTVKHVHGETPDPTKPRHISGQQLSLGLREFALDRWGMLARTVLNRWSIHGTIDFGRIVFAMVDTGLLATTEKDSVDDFRDVFDFRQSFEAEYRFPLTQLDGREVKA